MNQVTKIMGISFFTNLFLSFLKIVTGFLGKSGALIADGFHSLSDLGTDLVAIIGNKWALKPADEKHPYGHGKIEYVTSIFIACVIFLLGLTIIREGLFSAIAMPSFYVAIISLFTIFIKYLLSRFILKKGDQLKNNLLIASGTESKTDVYSSIVVFVSVLLMFLSKSIPILKYADRLAMILMGTFILHIGFQILKENMSSILEEQETDSDYLKQIQKIILQTKQVHAIDALRVLKYGSYLKIDAELKMNPFSSLLKTHRYLHEVEHHLRNYDERILYVTLHANPDESYHLVAMSKQKKKEFLKSLSLEDEALFKNQIEAYFILIDGKEKGHVSYVLQENQIVLLSLYLDQDYRHCGIGSDIIIQLKQKYPHLEILFTTDSSHQVAISFLKKLDFKMVKSDSLHVKLIWNSKKIDKVKKISYNRNRKEEK